MKPRPAPIDGTHWEGAFNPWALWFLLSIILWPIPKPHELAQGLAEWGHTVVVITGCTNYPAGRPVYLVEDNQTVANPGTVDSVKRMVVRARLRYETVGSVKLFNPVHGRSEMRVYRIFNLRASGPSGGGRSRASVPRWDA